MKLSYYCSSCKRENFIKTKTRNRHDFLMEFGKNEINERCKHCGNFTKRHINRLHAEPNNILIILSIVLAIFLTVLFWNFGFISKLIFALPLVVWIGQNKITSNFNRTRVK